MKIPSRIVTRLGMVYICCGIMAGSSLQASAGSTASSPVPVTVSLQTPPEISPEAQSAKSGGNPIGQLVGYVKDSVVRMKDGSVELYTNHQRCNEIRSKQKAYLSSIAVSLPASEQKAAQKYTPSAGGIDYAEFSFLQRGRDDRSKLANIVFMMFFAPNFVPYAFMFFPEMLPSPFATPAQKMGSIQPFSKFDQISRERSHAVIQTMLDLEKSARVVPMMSNLNPFGKGRTRRMMDAMDQLGHKIGSILVADCAVGRGGAEIVLDALSDRIYVDCDARQLKRAATLTEFPKCVVKGLGRALEAPTFNSLLPTFFVRGKLLNSLKQIEVSDQFFVDQNVDLTSLSSELLQEACSTRLIGGPGRTDEEMIEGLSSWLDLSVRRPEQIVGETGKHYNGNLARAALLCFNVLEGARDGRSASYLPRLMYQGQILKNVQQTSTESGGASNEKPSERRRRFI